MPPGAVRTGSQRLPALVPAFTVRRMQIIQGVLGPAIKSLFDLLLAPPPDTSVQDAIAKQNAIKQQQVNEKKRQAALQAYIDLQNREADSKKIADTQKLEAGQEILAKMGTDGGGSVLPFKWEMEIVKDFEFQFQPIGTTGYTSLEPQTPVAQDWPAKVAKWKTELDETDKQIAATREALLRLSATIQADRNQFEQYEKDAQAGFDRSINMLGDIFVDFSAAAISERYDKMHELAKKLPDKPTDLIEKYRNLASLAKRMQEAKTASDFAKLAASENNSKAEMYETLRDGVGQLIGMSGLEDKVPAIKAWKYGCLASDMIYNLTELYQGWKNVTVLEGNAVLQRKAVEKLAEQMRLLQESKKQLRTKIDAGE